MKLAILLGGPLHSTMKWYDRLPQYIEYRHEVEGSMFPMIEKYPFAFGDEYVGIYYWGLNDYQTKAIREQCIQLRNRYDE